MESIFSMGREVELPSYLESLIHYFGSSYICLWSYHPHPSNSLVFLAGFYQHHHLEQQQQQQQVRRHFDDYTHSSFTPLNDRVPGHAFKMNHPFVELYEPQLMRMASILPQRLFYKEAMIKTAVFMGCRSGEIEIGWSNLTPQQMRIESEMMKLFPDNFSSGMIQVAAGNQPPSSSSSSLRSPSLDNNSPEYSSFLLNLTAAFHPPNLQAVSTSTSSTSSQLQQIMQLLQQPPQSTSLEAMQALAGGHESQVDAAMTRALLAVFTSPSSSNTSSAFSKFSNPTGLVASSSSRRNASMFKRALTYYRRSFMMTRRRRQIEEEEQMNNLAAASRPTSTQLHHMISERRRREKINDSFQSLRALLPPDVKVHYISISTYFGYSHN
ncbi:Putative transcription factor bHLH041 [Linum perenne]